MNFVNGNEWSDTWEEAYEEVRTLCASGLYFHALCALPALYDLANTEFEVAVTGIIEDLIIERLENDDSRNANSAN